MDPLEPHRLPGIQPPNLIHQRLNWFGGRSDGIKDAGGADEQGQGDGQEKGDASRICGAEKKPVFNHAHQHPLVVCKGGVVVIKLQLLNTSIGGIGKIAVIH